MLECAIYEEIFDVHAAESPDVDIGIDTCLANFFDVGLPSSVGAGASDHIGHMVGCVVMPADTRGPTPTSYSVVAPCIQYRTADVSSGF